MAILECKDLKKRYGPTEALRGVSFNLEPGRITGLLGPNGSGKTTFIKLTAGLLVQTSGLLKVCGMEPGRKTKALVSYLPERLDLPLWMKVEAVLNYFRSFYKDFDRDRAADMLEGLGVPLDKPIRALSKGTREKVRLICCMSRKAKLYLLDEPVGGVDPATRDFILRTIIANFDPEAAVLISTHLIGDVEKVLDDVIFLDKGLVKLQSSVDAIRQERGCDVDTLFREVFRC